LPIQIGDNILLSGPVYKQTSSSEFGKILDVDLIIIASQSDELYISDACRKICDENHNLRIACRRWATMWSEDTGQDMPVDKDIFSCE